MKSVYELLESGKVNHSLIDAAESTQDNKGLLT